MSLNVYDGFRFPDGMPLSQVYLELMQLGEELRLQACQKQSTLLIDHAVTKLDMWSWFGVEAKAEGVPPLAAAYRYLLEAQERVRVQRLREPMADFSASVTVIPRGEKLLGVFYTDQDGFREHLKAKPWHMDYAYWNSSDPDEVLAPEEWQERHDDWSYVYYQMGCPALCGFSMDLVLNDQIVRPTVAELIPLAPAFEVRVKRLAKEALFHAWCEQNNHEIHSGNVMHIMMEFHKWLESEEGILSRDFQNAVVAERLIPEITEKVLLSPWNSKATLHSE